MRAVRLGLLPVAAILLAGSACSRQPDHFAIREVGIQFAQPLGDRADGGVFTLALNNCAAGSKLPYSVRTKETAQSVTVTVKGPVWTGDSQADCANTVRLSLDTPLGSRALLDGSNGRAVQIRTS